MESLQNNFTLEHNKYATPFIVRSDDLDVHIKGFEKTNNRYIVTLKTMTLEDDSYRIFVKGHYMSVIISQVKEVSKPIYAHNFNWNNYVKRKYEIFKNVDIWLPGDNFYLIRHYLMPGNQILRILLGELYKA